MNPTGSSYNRVAPMGWVDARSRSTSTSLRTSPAIDAGSAQFAPATDRDGTAPLRRAGRRRIRIRLGASARANPRTPAGPARHPVRPTAAGHHLPARAARMPEARQAARRDLAEGARIGTADPASRQSPTAPRADAQHSGRPPFRHSDQGPWPRARAVPRSDHRHRRQPALEGGVPRAARALTRRRSALSLVGLGRFTAAVKRKPTPGCAPPKPSRPTTPSALAAICAARSDRVGTERRRNPLPDHSICVVHDMHAKGRSSGDGAPPTGALRPRGAAAERRAESLPLAQRSHQPLVGAARGAPAGGPEVAPQHPERGRLPARPV